MTEELDTTEIEARLKAIAPYPWALTGPYDWGAKRNVYLIASFGGNDIAFVDHYASPLSEGTAQFIAHAPEDIAALLAEIERLEERYWENAS